MTDEGRIALLARRIRDMSAADRSVLDAMLQSPEPEVNLATTSGSANDQLWSEMAALGWMSLEPADDLPTGSRLFKIGVAGKAAITELLNEMRREAMPALFNELCREIPPQIAQRVVAAGGSPADVALMLAGIVEATMRRWIKPELHDEFLRAVADQTQALRKQFQSRG